MNENKSQIKIMDATSAFWKCYDHTLRIYLIRKESLLFQHRSIFQKWNQYGSIDFVLWNAVDWEIQQELLMFSVGILLEEKAFDVFAAIVNIFFSGKFQIGRRRNLYISTNVEIPAVDVTTHLK